MTIAISIIIIIITIAIGFGLQNSVFATTESVLQGELPNINASSMFERHSMILGNNVKNLVVVIPNEAHESTNQPKDQYPLANQPYLPQNAVVNVGTTVIWFNGDVDHDHTITTDELSGGGNSNSSEFETGDFTYNAASIPITFNNTGVYNYFEKDVNSDDPSFVMNGTIRVTNQPTSLSNAKSTAVNPVTVKTYMVPAMNLDQYISALSSKGFSIDSTHTFKDLRGGQEGTGPEQTLIVWTSSGMELDQVVAALKETTPSLPYS